MRIFLILLLALLLAGWPLFQELAGIAVDRHRLEQYAGAELPGRTRLYFKRDAVGGFLSGRESIRIYSIEGDEGWFNEERCDRNGFSKTEVVDLKVRTAASAETGTSHLPGNAKTSDWELSIPVRIKRSLKNDLPVCHKYRVKYDGAHREYEEAIFAQEHRVIHYWAASGPE